MKPVLLQGRGICKEFPQGGQKNLVLNHVDIDIYQGDFTVIMGASGAGKSTLLYALSGMDRITEGELLYKGKQISAFPEGKMASLRAKEFGFVFQQTNLVSNLTLFENVAVAGYVGKLRPFKEVDRVAGTLLSQMGIKGAKERLPAQVSGGEAQRAAIARAMINDPGLIFADEPTGALNKSNSQEVLGLLSGLNHMGQSILMVTHDVGAAIRGNRLLYLEDGAVIDELALPPFEGSDSKERESRVNTWLSSLRW